MCRVPPAHLDSSSQLCYKRATSSRQIAWGESMTRARSILVLLTIFLAGSLMAQATGRIAGRVTRGDGSGLSGVIVTIQELSQAEVTDANGNYAFNNVPAGSYTLLFSAGEQADTLTNVTVNSGATTRADKSTDWQI